MRRLVDRFGAAAAECSDLPQLRTLLADACGELGFDHFALLHHASLGGSPGAYVRIDNYPEDWVEEHVSRNYAVDDPIHLASRRTNLGFAWGELGNLIKLERRHMRILERGRRFGLGAGFTMPAHVPGEPGASCSFAVRTGREMPSGRLACAELIGARALCAARRLRPEVRRERPHLSRRELQCLKLIALGKTNWEIARILGLSTHTAHQYVKRARAAYNSVSRAQLVAYALRDQWISFEDAIPPNG